MTPDKRLNQLEPTVADVVQKVDRLIEGNGQIIHEVSKIPGIEKNVSVIATGLAELTVSVNQRFDQIDQRFVQTEQRFDQVDQRFSQVDQRFIEVDWRFDQQQLQIDSLRDEMHEGFRRIDQRFDQLTTLIIERLK